MTSPPTASLVSAIEGKGYYALVLCRKAEPGKQWVAPLHPTKQAISRSQGALLCRPQYRDIRPLYRLHIRFRPDTPNAEGERKVLSGQKAFLSIPEGQSTNAAATGIEHPAPSEIEGGRP